MTHRIDHTLPHHPALGLVLGAAPPRPTLLDDLTAAQNTDAPPPAHRGDRHTHFGHRPDR
jgi:hypothetical protein